MKKRFLFLYLKTWGGHISTARAIAKYIDQHYPSTIDPVLVDGFTQAPWWLKKLVVDWYKVSQTKGQKFYEFLYRCNKWWFIAKISQVILSWMVQWYIRKMIQQQQPSHITILHFFLVRPTVHALKQLKLDIPVTTIITDPFTLHKLRSLDKKMQYIVFSERAKNIMLDRGVHHSQIQIYPTILKEEFSHPMSAEKIIEKKKELWLALDKKIVFIMWAGDGIPKWEKILQQLIASKIDAQIMMVCGNNHKLHRQAEKFAQKHPEYTIKIFWFVDFMYDLVNVADIIITKGWPATLMEILMMSKIPIINSYIREQEKWNMQFVVENNVGFYQPNIKKMVDIVHDMIHSDLSLYHQNIKNLQLRNGTAEVAEHLLKK